MKNSIILERAYPTLTKVAVNGSLQDTVNAQELYEFLGLKGANAKRWFLRLTESYDFVEGRDYAVNPPVSNETLPFSASNISLTLRTARETSLVSKTDFGRAYRRYLLNLEDQEVARQQNQVLELKNQVLQLQASQAVEYYSMRDFMNVKGFIGFSQEAVKFNGKLATAYCGKHGLNIVRRELKPNLYQLQALEDWYNEATAKDLS